MVWFGEFNLTIFGLVDSGFVNFVKTLIQLILSVPLPAHFSECLSPNISGHWAEALHMSLSGRYI